MSRRSLACERSRLGMRLKGGMEAVGIVESSNSNWPLFVMGRHTGVASPIVKQSIIVS